MDIHTVNLTPEGDSWNMTYNGQHGNGPSSYPRIVLGTDTGVQQINFQIDPHADKQIVFSTDQSNPPIWVHSGAGKPGKGATQPQILAWTVVNKGRELQVIDANNNPSLPKLQLQYQLNFDNHGALDPIIDNGGTTHPPACPTCPPLPHPNKAMSTKAATEGPGALMGGIDLSAIVIGLI